MPDSTYPVEGLTFRMSYDEKTKSILTEWRDRSKTVEQLQYAANTPDAMAGYVGGDFAKWRPLLRKRFGFAPSDMGVDGGTLTFPGGELSHEYTAESKDSGSICRRLRLDVDWFSDSAALVGLFHILDFRSDDFVVHLGVRLVPEDQIIGLEANGWEVEEESADKVVASKGPITLTVKERMLIFEGFRIDDLLASGAPPNAGQLLLAETLAAVTPPKKT